jgi:subtilisin family serine protease/subtilisin-like proprotein convertase family protein
VALLAAWLVALLAGCGGGGDSSSPASDGLPDQSGCFYRFSLTAPVPRTGTDPLLANQWHLNNTGQTGGTAGEDVRAFAAWSVTRGAGATRVAVVDDAVDVLHEDLAPNVVAAASYSYRRASLGSVYPLPCAAEDDHGTAVAAIVAARDDNAAGGAGVAPRSPLVAYSALATGFDADIADALARGKADNGVYQNSWGSPDDGKLGTVSSTIGAAIDNGIANARGGKGAVYVFPAGNGGCYSTDANGGCYNERTGLDGYLNHIGVISVGSVDHRGRRPIYGETGANLLVSAPSSNHSGSASITTARPKNEYRSDFSGSSASAPMVSGVVALMLAANPELTWRDVRLILAQSARRNDPADPGWVASAFGPAHNSQYGFGVADAQAAVAAARGWASVGGSSTLRRCGPYDRSPNLALPDADGTVLSPREDAIAVDTACAITRIEYVEIEFTASHAYSGDMRIRLISPNALVSELADERVCEGEGDACGSYDGWRFGSVRHLNEPAGGTWRLRVTDAQPQDTGVWQTWRLTIWGR